MSYHISVLFTLAAFVCIIGVVSGAASGAGTLIDITQVSQSGNDITATVTIENSGQNPIASKYLGLYLLPVGQSDAEEALFVGWTALPYLRSGEKTSVSLFSPIPSGTVGGTYQATAIVGTSYSLASPRFTDAAIKEIEIIGTSKTETPLTMMTTSAVVDAKPNYQITAITASSSMLYPGARITPKVSIVNSGGDPQDTTPLSVVLWLGNQALYPEEATVPALAAGKSKNVQLSYKIPENIYLGSYVLRGIVNPYGIVPESNMEDNMIVASGSYFISDNWVEAKIAGGGCGCSS
jgi:uncharacterized membrane protein